MKFNKRIMLPTAVGLLLVGAAVAVPVGVVYGTSNAVVIIPAPVTVDHSDQTVPANKQLNRAYTWGTDLAGTVPPLSVTGKAAADYSAGVVDNSTITADTAVGEGTAVVTYRYQPKASSNPVLLVKYGLNITKGTPRNLSGVQTNDDPIKVGYGAGIVASEAAAYAAFVATYGYKPVTGQPADYQLASDNTTLTAAGLATLPAGTSFRASRTNELDTAHFNAADAAGTVLQAQTRNTRLFIVEKIAAANPTAAEKTLAARSLPFGSLAGGNYPVNANEPYAGHVRTSVEGVVTKASARTVDANHLNPAVGTRVNPAEINKYNAGTEFTVTYSYAPDANHTGNAFTVTGRYTVVLISSVAPAQSRLAVASEVAYATLVTTGSGNTLNAALPTRATAAPTSASLDGVGYDNGTASEMVTVTGQDPVNLGPAVTNHAISGDFAWAAVRTFNAGTTFTAKIKYKPLADHEGSEVELVRTFKVVPLVRRAEADENTYTNEASLRSYAMGSDLAPLAVEDQAARTKFVGSVYLVNSVTYYTGSLPTDTPAPAMITGDQVRALPVGARFFVRFSYVYNSNYTVSRNFVKQDGGKENGETIYRVAYKVVAPAA